MYYLYCLKEYLVFRNEVPDEAMKPFISSIFFFYSTDFGKMSQLSIKGRNLVLQLNADGKSQREIAEELGCSKTFVFRNYYWAQELIYLMDVSQIFHQANVVTIHFVPKGTEGKHCLSWQTILPWAEQLKTVKTLFEMLQNLVNQETCSAGFPYKLLDQRSGKDSSVFC